MKILRYEGMQECMGVMPDFPLYTDIKTKSTHSAETFIKQGIKLTSFLHNYLRPKDIVVVYNNGINEVNPR